LFYHHLNAIAQCWHAGNCMAELSGCLCSHKWMLGFAMGCVQDPQGTVVVEGSELSAVVTEIADVTAGPEEGSIALAKRIYAHLYEGNLSSRYARQETLGAVSAALRNLQQ